MRYSQAIKLLESFIDYEKSVAQPGQYCAENYNLQEFTRFLRQLGNPEKQLRCIHIAGTKGKGSIATMLSSILTAQGYRTGLFLSPHIYTYRERIQIDGQWMKPQEFSAKLDYLVQSMNSAQKASGSGFRTVFELLTAMALLYFQEKKVDIAVIETGLGGRLDATNVIKPLLCIISVIGLDHTILLGTTIESVSREKAGIIKSGASVVMAPQQPEHQETVLEIINKKCQQEGAKLIKSWEEADVKMIEMTPQGMLVEMHHGKNSAGLRAECPFVGDHQLNNLQATLATINQLKPLGLDVSDRAIVMGLSRSQLDGRVEVLECRGGSRTAHPGGDRLKIIIDSSHCPLSIKALVNSLQYLFPGTERYYLLNLMADKDTVGIIKELANDAMLRHLTTYDIAMPRSCSAEELAGQARQYIAGVSVADSPEEALESTVARAKQNSIIVACGTTYSVARLKDFCRRSLVNRIKDTA